jgi:hypothetical protein
VTAQRCSSTSAAWALRASYRSGRMRPIAAGRRGGGLSRTTRRARRCAGSARRSGANLGAPRPSWFCPNGKPEEGDYSQADNDSHERGHFDDGKPSWVKCHDALLGGIRATALIYVKRGGRARSSPTGRVKSIPTVQPGPRKGASAGLGGGDAHRFFTAAQNCSVTAVVSSVTFQPSLSAFSLANLCSI